QPDVGAGAGQLPERLADPMDEGQRPSRLRLLQPLGPREPWRGVLDLPRACGPDAPHVPGRLAADGVVPGVPPPARALRAAAGGRVRRRLRAPCGPARAGEPAREGVRYPDSYELLHVSSMKPEARAEAKA